MKIDKVITSVNNNHLYKSFVALTVKAWNILGVECEVVYTGENGNIAKASRIIQASMPDNHDRFIMIADIDMIPLVSPLSAYESCPDDHLCKFGYEHPAFQKYPDVGKWPMHGTAAKGSTFQKIVNPNNLSPSELIQDWSSRSWAKDTRANPNNPFVGFSDESLLKYLWQESDVPDCLIKRTALEGYDQHPDGGYTVYGRICRSKWGDVGIEELDKYFEIHGPRPCDLEGFYKPVLEYITKDKK